MRRAKRMARPWRAFAFALALLPAAAFAQGGAVYSLRADGLSCPFCTYGIEKELGRVAGVASIATDIESGTVTVTMDEGRTLKEREAREAVKRAGFTLRGFSPKDAG